LAERPIAVEDQADLIGASGVEVVARRFGNISIKDRRLLQDASNIQDLWMKIS
jgi:hypothetical protein